MFTVIHSSQAGELTSEVDADRFEIDQSRNRLSLYKNDELVGAYIMWMSVTPSGATESTQQPPSPDQSAPQPGDEPPVVPPPE